VIGDVVGKCREINRQNRFIRKLTGRAGDPGRVDSDLDYVMLRIHADKLIVLAQELRALIPT